MYIGRKQRYHMDWQSGQASWRELHTLSDYCRSLRLWRAIRADALTGYFAVI